jgi:flagellar L-ring protein precursor FlgH
MSLKTGIALSLVVALAAGCAHEAPLGPSAAFAPVFPVDPPKQSNLTGAIYQELLSDNYFGRKRNYQVGDIITVVLNESTNATRNQNTTTSRATVNTAFPSIQAGVANALSNTGIGMPGLGSLAKNAKADANTISSDGSEKAGQYQSLTGSIAVTIVEVFSNGNLAVRGEKHLAFNEGPEVIQVAGIVRIEDIAPDGTVQSKRLSNAQIAYRGSGEGADASRASWGTRALYKYWPF